MPQPTLLTIDEDTNKLKRLQEENEILRQRLSESVKIENISDVNPGSAPQHLPIMDDFYIIAQYVHICCKNCFVRNSCNLIIDERLIFNRESPLLENPKTLRNLIRNIGGGSSPILSRKLAINVKKITEPEMCSTKRTNTKGRINSISKSEAVAKRSISCDSRLSSSRKRDSSMDTAIERKTKEKIDSSYILLSQVKKKYISR